MASYTATQSGDWNTNSTWGGGGHPVAGDTANINSTYMVTVGTAAACAVVDCTGANGGGGITLNAGLTTTGNVTLVSGMTFTPNSQTWTMGCSSVALATGGKHFYNLTFNVAGTLTLSDTLNVDNTMTTSGVAVVFSTSDVNTKNLTCTAGTFAGTGRTINIASGTWTASSNGSTVATNVTMTGACTITTRAVFKTGTLNATGATLTMTSSDTLYIAGDCTFTDATNTWVNINCNNSATLTLSQATTISGTLSVATGQTLTLATNDLSVQGNLTCTGTGIITGRTINLIAPVSTSQTWSSGGGAVKSNLTFNTAGTIVVSGTVYYSTGTITYTAGTMTTTDSTLRLTGNCTINNSSSTQKFNNLTSGSGYILTLSNHLYLNGNLANDTSGAFYTNGTYTIYVGGNLTLNNSLNANSGTLTVEMNGTGAWSTTSSSGELYTNLKFNTTGTITVSSNVYYRTGTITYVAGTMNLSGSTLNITGSSNTRLTDATNTWVNINCTATATLTLSQATTISGNLSVATGATLTLSTNDISVQGNLTCTGTGIITGRTITMTGSGTWSSGGGAVKSNLTFNTAGTIVVSGNVYYSTGVLTYTAGTISIGGASNYIVTKGNCTFNLNGVSFGNIEVNAGTTTLSSALVCPILQIDSGTVLACGTNSVTVTGNLTNNSGSASTWRTGNNTFIFNGTTTIAGASNFYNFTINAGKTVHLTSTQTFAVAGTFTAAGTALSHVTLDATTGSSAALFNVTTVGSVSNVDATDINSAGGTTVHTLGGSVTRTTNWTLDSSSSSSSSSVSSSCSSSCSRSSSSCSRSSSSCSCSSSSSISTMPTPGGMAFGVQTPSYGEKPVSWQTFDNGSGSVPTIIGDPDWGKMEIAFNEQGRSRVYAFPDNQLRCITLSTDRYKSGDGAATPQIRGNSSEFAQDDNTIPWNDYTGTTRQTWRYVQMRVIKQT